MADMTVGQLEEALFSAFPREDAECWDRPGLAIGQRGAHVGSVACALDMSTQAVLEAAAAGCDVLVTHHPPYIKDGPASYGPADEASADGPGRMFYEAARQGVSCIAMHTNADRSVAVREAYARLLGCTCLGNFEHLMDAPRTAEGTGFGALLAPQDGPVELGELATRCVAAFGGAPRVWGKPERSIGRIAFLNGSWSEPELYGICIRAGIDCMVVGETRYHVCVDAQPALSVIELGHDKSELAIVDVLASAIAGLMGERPVMLESSRENWWVPTGEERHV